MEEKTNKQREGKVRGILEAEKSRPDDRLYLIKKIHREEQEYTTPQSVDYGSERVDKGIFATNPLEREMLDKHIKLEQMKKKVEELRESSVEYNKILEYLKGDDYVIIYSYYSCGMNDEEIAIERILNGSQPLARSGVRSKRNRIISMIAEHVML